MDLKDRIENLIEEYNRNIVMSPDTDLQISCRDVIRDLMDILNDPDDGVYINRKDMDKLRDKLEELSGFVDDLDPY